MKFHGEAMVKTLKKWKNVKEEEQLWKKVGTVRETDVCFSEEWRFTRLEKGWLEGWQTGSFFQ